MKVTDTDDTRDTAAFGGLSPAELSYLRQWQQAASAIGIDAVEDLTNQSWPCAIPGAVIGVFLSGEQTAAWLVVKHNGTWAVARCADCMVSSPVGTLADALAELYPPDTGFREAE